MCIYKIFETISEWRWKHFARRFGKQSTDKVASTIDTVNFSGAQMELLKDLNLLMDPTLKKTVSDKVLHVLQKGMGTGILQVFAVSVAAALIIFMFGCLAGKARLVMPHGSKKLGFH